MGVTRISALGSESSVLDNPASPLPVATQTTDALTSLLLGMTKQEVQELRASVENKGEFVDRVSAVLGEAVEQSATNPRLKSALGVVTQKSVLDIAKSQPDKLGEAIAPVMAPAIRGMVSLAMADLNERVESIIQQSFSLQGIKWRIEAARTGTPLSELVLRDTLTYRVEHALLIHRSSGTLLNHAMRREYEGKDPAVVAAMLTAVKQFLEDAFTSTDSGAGGGDDREELSHQFSAGDTSIVVKAAGELALAVVVRGTQTVRLEQLISAALENLLGAYGSQALAFDGDVEKYAGALPLLEECLVTEEAKKAASAEASKAGKFDKVRRYAPVLAICLALAGWAGYQQHAAQKNWQNFIVALKQQPGLAITDAVKVDGDTALINGLRDPDSTDLAIIATQFGYPNVSWNLKRYLSLESSITLVRARRLLSPPRTISLRLGQNTLRVTGRASDEWLRSIEHLSVPGVATVDVSRVMPPKLIAPVIPRVQPAFEKPPQPLHP